MRRSAVRRLVRVGSRAASFMNDWKRRLYAHYVSSGQATGNYGQDSQPSWADNPYYRQVITHHLPKNKDVAIADVACGHGALLHCLRESGYRNLRGVDVSTEQVALAHKQGVVEAQCGEMSGFLLDKTGAYEVVFLMDISGAPLNAVNCLNCLAWLTAH